MICGFYAQPFMISLSKVEGLIVTAVAPSRGRSASPSGVRLRALGALSAFLVGLAGGIGPPQLLAGEDPSARMEVQVRNGLVSLDVRNAPLADVIREIGEVADFETVVRGPLDMQITRFLAEMPVYEAVRQLMREINFVIIHAPGGPNAGTAQINMVRLYRPTRQQTPPPSVAAVRESVDPALLAGLSADDDRTRVWAVQKLGHTGEESAITVLERVIREDENVLVRGQAAVALGRIGGNQVIPPLHVAVGDPHQTVRLQAVRALRRIGGERTAQILGEVLLLDADRRVRRTAALSLARAESELARAYLRAALSDPDSVVRTAASQSLGRWEAAEEDS